jgi:hypothetical protein
MTLGLSSQHFIVFVGYEWAQKVRLLQFRGGGLARDQHSSIFCTFVSFEEMKCYGYDPGTVFTTLLCLRIS